MLLSLSWPPLPTSDSLKCKLYAAYKTGATQIPTRNASNQKIAFKNHFILATVEGVEIVEIRKSWSGPMPVP